MPLLAEPDDFYGGRGASRSRTYRMLPCQRAFGHESGEARRTRRSRASRLGFPGTVERRGSETTLVSASPVLESPRVAPGPARAETVSAAAATAGRLYEEHYERVFGYCLYKLGMRQEAEDAAQTTFLWALRSLEAGIEPRLEANWLFTIAQNACRARIRTRGRRRDQEVLSDPQILQRVAPGRSGVEEALVGLEEALRDMPELQRQAIVLREWRGFSYKEIAETLGLSHAAVETLIFRARRSLASRLEYPASRTRTKARALALDIGSLASGLKSLLSLGLGTGVKVGAVASTVAAVALGVGVPGDTPTVEANAAKAPVHVPASANVTPTDVAPALSPTTRDKPKELHEEAGSMPFDTGSAAVPERLPDQAAAEGVRPDLDAVPSEIRQVVGTVTEPLETAASALPPLPPLP
jgi:RNA polymerase sigma-70 factor, ECF subfamily